MSFFDDDLAQGSWDAAYEDGLPPWPYREPRIDSEGRQRGLEVVTEVMETICDEDTGPYARWRFLSQLTRLQAHLFCLTPNLEVAFRWWWPEQVISEGEWIELTAMEPIRIRPSIGLIHMTLAVDDPGAREGIRRHREKIAILERDTPRRK